MDELDAQGTIAHDAASLARDLIRARIRHETDFGDFVMGEIIRRGPTKVQGTPDETDEDVWNRVKFDQAFSHSLVMIATLALLAGSKAHPDDPPNVDAAVQFLEQLTDLDVTF